MARRKKIKDASTEEKIKEAARKLFTQKGFAAVKTRDIATEAGINVALLNYYFRSKENLFGIIMRENMLKFAAFATALFNDEKLTVEQKMEQIVSAYIDMLLAYPDLPLFVMNEAHRSNDFLNEMGGIKFLMARSHFVHQVEDEIKKGNLEPIHRFHLMANFMGMIIFPFLAAPMLKQLTGVTDKQYKEFVMQRKGLIPKWMNAVLKTKT